MATAGGANAAVHAQPAIQAARDVVSKATKADGVPSNAYLNIIIASVKMCKDIAPRSPATKEVRLRAPAFPFCRPYLMVGIRMLRCVCRDG